MKLIFICLLTATVVAIPTLAGPSQKAAAAERKQWIEILGCGKVLATIGRPDVCLDDESATVFGFLMAVRGSVNSMSPEDPAQTCRLFGNIETSRRLLKGQIYRFAERIDPNSDLQGALRKLSSDFGLLATSNRWSAVTEYCLQGSPDRFSYRYLRIMYLRYMREDVKAIEAAVEKVNVKLGIRLPYNRWDGGGPLNDPEAADKIFDEWQSSR